MKFFSLDPFPRLDNPITTRPQVEGVARPSLRESCGDLFLLKGSFTKIGSRDATAGTWLAPKGVGVGNENKGTGGSAVRLPRLVSVEAIARQTGLSTAQLYRYAREGLIPHWRLGRTVKLSEAAVAAWLRDTVAR